MPITNQGQRPSVEFTISPDDGTISYTLGGTTYPYQHQLDGISRASDSRYEVHSIPADTPVTFTASAVVPAGIVIYEYRWKFGDGDIGYGPVVTHSYRTVSSQTQIVLSVLDNKGNITTRLRVLNLHAGKKITVSPKLIL